MGRKQTANGGVIIGYILLKLIGPVRSQDYPALTKLKIPDSINQL